MQRLCYKDSQVGIVIPFENVLLMLIQSLLMKHLVVLASLNKSL